MKLSLGEEPDIFGELAEMRREKRMERRLYKQTLKRKSYVRRAGKLFQSRVK